MKTLSQSLKVLSLAFMVLFFSNCTKDPDEIIPETNQNQGTNETPNTQPNTNPGETNTGNGNGETNDPTEEDPIDALFDDNVNYNGDVLVGDWSIDTFEYALDEGGSMDDANGSGTLTFNSNGTGSRSYIYSSSVSPEGSYYTVDESFEWRKYVIDATDDTPEIHKLQLRGSNGDVTWTRTVDEQDEQGFSFTAIPNGVTHYYEVTVTRGLPDNHLIGEWTVDSMMYNVVETGESGNGNAQGAITFNADGTGSREYTFQSIISEGDETHLTKDESFTWWLVGTDKIKIDNSTDDNQGWIETWNRMEDSEGMQKATFMLNIGGKVHEYTITFVK